jgi:hypothetical protein
VPAANAPPETVNVFGVVPDVVAIVSQPGGPDVKVAAAVKTTAGVLVNETACEAGATPAFAEKLTETGAALSTVVAAGTVKDTGSTSGPLLVTLGEDMVTVPL